VVGGVVHVNGRAVTVASVKAVFAAKYPSAEIVGADLLRELLHPFNPKNASDEVRTIIKALMSKTTASTTRVDEAGKQKKLYTLLPNI